MIVIGNWIKKQLEHLVDILNYTVEENSFLDQMTVGKDYIQINIKTRPLYH